ncbi:uncharacterized protein Z518_04595 [Rhinocladiella mackenziei CBS 650.93]|uniref:Uncharacterized protein n=1 Tax=Rhinocladiella mackenziei CBS 650.93 TaxID=1442369 RepID=A0A0D2ILK4_9EURO|nr:uncharacterized protein Z518_04595 [Rhinocladiella mackenziei CBS 650.93]KIX06619.1 hypothetical protein Z518_04595 [Rhinocladiella mackenziei CBS 650.93]
MSAQKESVSVCAAHHEVAETSQANRLEVHTQIAAYEERKIDLRTIMAIAGVSSVASLSSRNDKIIVAMLTNEQSEDDHDSHCGFGGNGIVANGLALVLVAIFYWPPSFIGLHPEGITRMQQFQELDFIGLLLFSGGLNSFLIAISWSNNPYSWRSVEVLAPLSLGEVQPLFASDPNRIGWFSVAYNTPVTLGGAAAAFSFNTFGHTRFHFFIVTLLHAVFTASVASITQHIPAQAIVLVVLAALFVGATYMLKILMLQFGAPDTHIGLTTGLMCSTTATGGAIALAVNSTIIRDQTSILAPAVAEAAVQAGLSTSEIAVAFLSHSATSLEAIRGLPLAILVVADDASNTIYSQAFRLVYLVTIAFGVPACIAAFFIRSVRVLNELRRFWQD